MTAGSIGAGLLLVLLAGEAAAQDYVARIDTRLQDASYRGILKDSIRFAQTVPAPSGGLQTPDGYAASCLPGQTFCYFNRAGPILRGGPFVTSVDLTAWGLGLRGLSLHANARFGVDLGTADVWPGTNPAAQLIEGYAEYASDRVTARLGRQIESGRLGHYGYDGPRLAYTFTQLGITAIGYAGLGLASPLALPVTSAVLNPLDDFQPTQRQLLAAGALEWQGRLGEARFDYEREVDRDTRNFVSERMGWSATIRPAPGWSVDGGVDYDLARGLWGSADLTLRRNGRLLGGSLGVRRYRPYFDLWTIWGVFSPVPYSAVNGSLWAIPLPALTLRASGERYRYANADADTPLLGVETEGWRWSVGASYRISSAIDLDVGYQAEFGPGAASNGVDGSLSLRPLASVTLGIEGGHLARPLEFRAEDPRLTWYGLSADYRVSERLRLGLRATRYDEDRVRPDASGIDWSQTRLSASVSWMLGSSVDRLPLPPALPPGLRR